MVGCTNGVFDLFHFGNLVFLERARQLGTRLVVGVNFDESARELKGPGRSIVSRFDRLEEQKDVFVQGTPFFASERAGSRQSRRPSGAKDPDKCRHGGKRQPAPSRIPLLGSQIGHELQKMTGGAMKTILPSNVMLYVSR
jgi:cytidyltransferase-like protein